MAVIRSSCLAQCTTSSLGKSFFRSGIAFSRPIGLGPIRTFTLFLLTRFSIFDFGLPIGNALYTLIPCPLSLSLRLPAPALQPLLAQEARPRSQLSLNLQEAVAAGAGGALAHRASVDAHAVIGDV